MHEQSLDSLLGRTIERRKLEGFDYNALLAATPDGARALDPRYGLEDLFNPGLSARISAKFIF